MVAREIVWSVSKDALTITPNAPQRGAVQGEHNVTKVVFNIPDDCVLLGDDLKLYIGCTDSTGGYDKTEPLTVKNGCVEWLLPRAWTQYGGTDVLELTAEKEDQIVYSVKARVVFESRPGTKKGEKKMLEGFMQAACDAAAESAERAAASEQAAAGHAEASAKNKSLTEQAARFVEERAASAAAASSVASGAANHASEFAGRAAEAQTAATASATRAEAAAAAAEQHAKAASDGIEVAQNAANTAAAAATKAKASEEAADNAMQAAAEMAEDAAGDAAIANKAAKTAESNATAAMQAAEAADNAMQAAAEMAEDAAGDAAIANEAARTAESNAMAAMQAAKQAAKQAADEAAKDVAEMLVGTLGYVTPQMFGAYGDGEHDDTTAIQAAMDAHLNVYIPSGTYLVNGYYKDFLDSPNGGIKLRSGQRVYMAYDCEIHVKTNNGAFYEAFNVYNCYNVEIHGGHIVGERDTHDSNTHASLPNRTQGFGIAVQNSENVLIENVEICSMWGDAIVLHTPDNVTGYNSSITIRNCLLHSCERQGISVVVGDNVLISNCIIGNISGHAPQSGIDIEPHSQATEDMYVHDVTIENCKFIDNVQSFCFSRCYNVTANNCSFGENVIAVKLATNVKFNNCDIFSAWMQNDTEPSFYGCRIGRVLNESTGITRFYDCYFTGAVPAGAGHSYIVAGNKGGSAHFKNCEFMLKCEGTDKTACKIVNGASKCRFEGCSFATVDNETVRLFANNGEYEFYGCHINLTTGYEYPFLNPTKLIMQNCNVKVSKMVCLYNGNVDSGYVFMSGNVFDAGSYICRVNDGTTFATAPSIALLNNVRNDVSRDFVRAIEGVTVKDINNNKI